MLLAPTIPKDPKGELWLDHEQLYAAGLKHVQRLAARIWTDYNVHDPGITTLELLSYALTDLSYRASFPVPDILADASGKSAQFFTAGRILPNRALTLLDYRKLLIDLKGVKNAWLQPAPLTYYADTIKGTLLTKKASQPGIKPVDILGLYNVIIDFNDGLTSAVKRSQVMDTVKATLQANRNLGEDFVNFRQVGTQDFLLCAEVELEPEADVSNAEAEIYFAVEQYFAPGVRNYTLEEMLARKKPDGTPVGMDEIFNGPLLKCGFIDDDELAEAELRTTIYLSDVIAVIMDVQGVRAVRDIVINPEFTDRSLEDKWVVPVPPGRKALLEREDSRLVFYKRNMPVTGSKAKAGARYHELLAEATAMMETETRYDLEIPAGDYRNPTNYYSFQNHFPALYGLNDDGLNGAADGRRKALALQLKAYLLFFDQVMANYLAQLGQVKDLLSADPGLKHNYFTQVVDSFPNSTEVYPAKPLTELKKIIEDADSFADRRNRFLDHLIARFAEQFTDLAHISYASLGMTPRQMIGIKCNFLEDYPERSSERSLAYDYTQTSEDQLWDTENVSGLERRLAKLLGLGPATRRNLSTGTAGMYVIEMILLRPELEPDPLLPICPDPNCTDCAEEDPYSYRIHVILPAEQERFAKMEFRRFVEEVIRQETPAHILPRICWISNEEMAALEIAYKDWLFLKAGAITTQRTARLKAFIDTLFAVRNIYPSQKLHECGGPAKESKFLLGQTALGTLKD